MKRSTALCATAVTLAAAGALFGATAAANPFAILQLPRFSPFSATQPPAAALDEPDAATAQDGGLSERFRRQTVDYRTPYGAGTVVIDTPNTYLYYVLGDGKALRYGIGVGREGYTWSGVQAISRKAEWPDWTPPSMMVQRQPYLPRFVAGGPHNPLGARAMYLGGTIYRIHGTNAPETIGSRVSSGCIRLTNDDVIDLYRRVKVGTKVVVLPMHGARTLPIASRRPAAPARAAVEATTVTPAVPVQPDVPAASSDAPAPSPSLSGLAPATPTLSDIVSAVPARAPTRSALLSIASRPMPPQTEIVSTFSWAVRTPSSVVATGVASSY